jgi:hypothetical protein
VVRELVRRGERVVYYDTEEFRAQIEATGAAFRPYPAGLVSPADIVASLENGRLADVIPVLLRATERLLPFAIPELERGRPDLVMYDSIVVWGRMAATLLKLRSVSSITHFIFDPLRMGGSAGDFVRTLGQALPQIPAILTLFLRLARTYKGALPRERPFFPVRGDLNLMYTARELQPRTPAIKTNFRFVGPSIETPVVADTPRTRKRIYISLGSVHAGDQVFYQTCFDAFEGMDADFVLSVGSDEAKARLGGAPANFEVTAWARQVEVLQGVDAFITHGGMNSIHEGLYFGVPLVLVPYQFEQMVNARCVAARGAGLILRSRLDRKPLKASDLRRALGAVLDKPRFRKSALALRDVLRATGGARQAADEVQAFLTEVAVGP